MMVICYGIATLNVCILHYVVLLNYGYYIYLLRRSIQLLLHFLLPTVRQHLPSSNSYRLVTLFTKMHRETLTYTLSVLVIFSMR